VYAANPRVRKPGALSGRIAETSAGMASLPPLTGPSSGPTVSNTSARKTRTLSAYVEALGGRLEIIADFGDQRLAFTEAGTETA
jgi:hypothetical protein